jgi:alkanesulfonate monooxygenase SsuD/methylene tetrahydromethanopterin reductase-like flavin-dependent oxidoreductase (luciferase family)
MRVGICILQDRRWAAAEPRWRRAEEYGFDHAWTYDHLGWRDLVDGPWFDGMLTLTAAAMVTSRIRLGTMVASPNFRHPVTFTREVTALDDISDGRLLLGVGAGGVGFDAAVLGGQPLAPRVRADRFIEFVELLDQLLRGDHVDWSGEHYTAVDARSTPGCRQHPRAPLVVAANGPRTIRFAARLGDGWMTTGPAADDLPSWWRGVAVAARRCAEALDDAERPPAAFPRYLSLDSAPVYSLSSVDAFVDAAGRAAELGFTDIVTHWPREAGPYAGKEAVLDQVACDVVPGLQAGGDPTA